MSDYEKFVKLYEEIDILIDKQVTTSDADFKAWRSRVERFLLRYFGGESYEYTAFSKTSFSLTICGFGTPHSDFVNACKKGLEVTKKVFKEYLEEMEIVDDNFQATEHIQIDILENREVFIVHGHDGELKEGLARILEKQNIKPIILSEQVNNGKTIIEKLEGHSNVRAAIILFTKDDICRMGETEVFRARQNVVFEAGYFMAKLGRSNVIIIKEDGVEIPGDLDGVVYTAKGNWQLEVFKELKSIGLEIDFNKLF